MKQVSIDDVEPIPHLMNVNSERRPLSRAVEEMNFAMVRFELQPGEAFSGAPHKHRTQQELFYVIEGTATWEVTEEPGGERETFEVGPEEFVHFDTDDVYQSGSNQGDEVVRAVAVGSPGARHEWSEVLGLADCPKCDRETAHTFLPTDDASDVRMPPLEEMVITCRECGNEL